MGFFYNTGDWEIHQLVISLNAHYFLPYGRSTILEDGKKAREHGDQKPGLYFPVHPQYPAVPCRI